ncbi:hypothetical protein FHX44_118372 [Pseudonocardia hierapolitana]|uniref:Uncharacterized protein n=1 Tax=Pseudonocardia hierapolitana TaxID=1128676 RepID=A0A561T5P1_9PSEU|nr:hypothetical protein FHX44_118372 [Pseudonocardia hierapolitana]
MDDGLFRQRPRAMRRPQEASRSGPLSTRPPQLVAAFTWVMNSSAACSTVI